MQKSKTWRESQPAEVDSSRKFKDCPAAIVFHEPKMRTFVRKYDSICEPSARKCPASRFARAKQQMRTLVQKCGSRHETSCRNPCARDTERKRHRKAALREWPMQVGIHSMLRPPLIEKGSKTQRMFAFPVTVMYAIIIQHDRQDVAGRLFEIVGNSKLLF